jgi:hypothetical protein
MMSYIKLHSILIVFDVIFRRALALYRGLYVQSRRDKQEADRRNLLIAQQQQFMPMRGARYLQPTGSGSLGPIGLLDGHMQGRPEASTEEILFGLPGLGPNRLGPQRGLGLGGRGPPSSFGPQGMGGGGFGRGPFG